jgi:hypothetical protein
MMSKFALFTKLNSFWLNHATPLFLFALISVAVSWPTARDFTTQVTSDGQDARHLLWVLWHVKEAFLGNQKLFDLSLLYYPVGASLFTHGLGPVMGTMALPFWLWGPEAAYNGAIITGLALTGYCMYLLARALGCDRLISFFAGLVLLLAPVHLAGIYGHLEKTFIGLFPLGFLALHYALDERRTAWWSVAAAAVAVLTLLHNGHHFIFMILGFLFFSLVIWLGAPERRPVLKRIFLLALATVLLVTPFLLLIEQAANNPNIPIGVSEQASLFQPALIEFFLPSGFSALFGNAVRQFLGLPQQVETAVSLPLIGILLCAVALWQQPRLSWPWLLFLLLTFILALGPTVKLSYIPGYNLNIKMPFAYLTELPGLSFIRTPGRFMLIGQVAFAVGAAIGLRSLINRYTAHRYWLAATAVLLLLLETWPQAWPQERLLPTPEFYRQLAHDQADYGVLDLPVIPTPYYWQINYATFYQMYQMTHKKGIAYGYISRTYEAHPLFPCLVPLTEYPQPDMLVNGQTHACFEHARATLAYYNYRYVVWHKPQPWSPWGYEPGSWGEQKAAELIEAVFGGETPLVNDDTVMVYQVQPAEAALTAQMGPLHNWYENEGGLRWATSPAQLYIVSPRDQTAVLEITPAMMYQPDSGTGWHVGHAGTLTVQAGRSETATVAVRADETVAVPLQLATGVNVVSLTLAAGNFYPPDFTPTDDQRRLSFAIRRLNLLVDQ